MTIKWVTSDPLVMRGEPFCYGSRVTVRQLLEARRGGADPAQLIREHPELKPTGIAESYRYAAANRARYGDFFGRDGSLAGPGFSPAAADAAGLPDTLRVPGVVVDGRARKGAA